MKAARFEIYTTNPITGEEGWDIKFRYTLGENIKEAREVLVSTPNFDCIILFDFLIDVEEIDDDLDGDLLAQGWADKIN